ncbi:hypothetical protein HC891_12265 [Candidatus Gracilibacteria bacterium]|nr:hypothetical protein [Candidatus Gracilibacteria bacterium]
MQQIILYDTTLRDGTQREGLSLSCEDKLKIARELDALGVHYIEGGWPGSNPKDAEFFQRIGEAHLRHARVAAFGSTRHAYRRCENDANIRALMDANTPVVTLVGKSSLLHVEQVLETTPTENLAMIGESVAFLKSAAKSGFTTPSISSTVTNSTLRTRSQRSVQLPKPVPTGWCSAIPMAVPCLARLPKWYAPSNSFGSRHPTIRHLRSPICN